MLAPETSMSNLKKKITHKHTHNMRKCAHMATPPPLCTEQRQQTETHFQSFCERPISSYSYVWSEQRLLVKHTSRDRLQSSPENWVASGCHLPVFRLPHPRSLGISEKGASVHAWHPGFCVCRNKSEDTIIDSLALVANWVCIYRFKRMVANKETGLNW